MVYRLIKVNEQSLQQMKVSSVSVDVSLSQNTTLKVVMTLTLGGKKSMYHYFLKSTGWMDKTVTLLM